MIDLSNKLQTRGHEFETYFILLAMNNIEHDSKNDCFSLIKLGASVKHLKTTS